MGLVEDDDVVGWQHAAAGGEVRKVEGVVDDEDVGALGVEAGPLGETVDAGRAARRAGAFLGAAAHGPPPGR